jgi:hypothetical protein
MAKFIVRIDFRRARARSVYEDIKAKVKNRGFEVNTMVNGSLFQLPIGEFFIEGNYTISEVLALVKSALYESKDEYSVLVTEVNALEGFNLLQAFEPKR